MLLRIQVDPNMLQQEFARQMLHEINRNPRFPPLAAAVDDAVDGLLEDAVDVSRRMGVLSQLGDSSGHRFRDQGPSIPPAAQAAATFYRPVLTQMFEAALRLHLLVQSTHHTTYIFVPGELAERAAACAVTAALNVALHESLAECDR